MFWPRLALRPGPSLLCCRLRSLFFCGGSRRDVAVFGSGGVEVAGAVFGRVRLNGGLPGASGRGIFTVVSRGLHTGLGGGGGWVIALLFKLRFIDCHFALLLSKRIGARLEPRHAPAVALARATAGVTPQKAGAAAQARLVPYRSRSILVTGKQSPLDCPCSGHLCCGSPCMAAGRTSESGICGRETSEDGGRETSEDEGWGTRP